MNEDTPIVNDHSLSPTDLVLSEMVTASGVTNSGVQTTVSGIISPFMTASGIGYLPGLGYVNGREIAYTIFDPIFDKFDAYKTAQAWWSDRTKVERLIAAFKSNMRVNGACSYAIISERQWGYFNDLHPDFCRVKEACEEFARGKSMVGAMNKFNIDGMNDLATVRWFLERNHPDFFPKGRVPDGTEVLQPQINNNVNVAVGVQIDAGEITQALKDVAREILGVKEENIDSVVSGALERITEEQSK